MTKFNIVFVCISFLALAFSIPAQALGMCGSRADFIKAL